jgi:hypothetical protein
VKLSSAGAAMLLAVLPAAGPAGGSDAASAAIASMSTDLLAPACERKVDPADPNETPYRLCPGVGGHALAVRLVESGRQSIDVVDPAQRAFPLDLHEVVTRYMASVDRTAHWRVARRDGKAVPVALIVRVLAHENAQRPERVTHRYLAIAKITPGETCVTDVVTDGSPADARVRRLADSAHTRPCLAPRPRS